MDFGSDFSKFSFQKLDKKITSSYHFSFWAYFIHSCFYKDLCCHAKIQFLYLACCTIFIFVSSHELSGVLKNSSPGKLNEVWIWRESWVSRVVWFSTKKLAIEIKLIFRYCRYDYYLDNPKYKRLASCIIFSRGFFQSEEFFKHLS